MALVTWKDLCVDSRDPAAAAGFWGAVLDRRVEPSSSRDGVVALAGSDPAETVWINRVDEPKTVKNRVHLDLRAPSLASVPGVRALGEPGELPWTVVAGPEGDEICVFIDESLDRPVLKDIVVDAADHATLAAWWAELFGVEVSTEVDGSGVHGSYLSAIPGVPFEDIDFGTVPEPKVVKNRVHWDVTLAEGSTVGDLVARGAVVLRVPDDEIRWTVLADPEGNEFCVFERG